MPIIIEIKQVVKQGLEVFEIKVNGTLLNTYMSRELAEAKKNQYLKAWNIDKVQLKGHAA